MAKKRKKYLVTSNSEAYACSLVTSPAVEETFVAFNEETPLIEKFADEKKHMVTGVVAIPNKPIYRRNADGEEYDIVFSEEAIEHMAKSFLKEYRQKEVTLQHQEEADGVYLVEQWIKTDMVYDKSISVGLSKELPIGSWIQTYYVDSNDVWKRIEDGELLGFSLECMLGLEEFETQINNAENENTMEVEANESFWSKLKQVLKEAFSTKEDEIEEEVIEEEMELEEETPNEAPNEPQEPSTEVEPIETPSEEKETIVEPKEEVVETPKVEEPKPNPLEELIHTLNEEVKALKESNNNLQERLKEMGKQPSANPVNTNAKPNPTDTYSAWREKMRSMVG